MVRRHNLKRRYGCAPPCLRITTMKRTGTRYDLMLMAVIWGLTMTGCFLAQPAYEGRAARTANRLPLEGLAGNAAVWSTREVVIRYEAIRQGDRLVMDGRIERLGSINNFARIDNFRVWLHFLNTEGIIIGTRLLWAAGVGVDARLVRWTFSQRLPLPPRAAAFGFSYRGAFSESGSEQGGIAGWEVRQAP